MKLSHKNIIYLPLIVLVNCASRDDFLTERSDIWIRDRDKGLFYCRANPSSNGLADPVCFEAGFAIYEEGVEIKRKK